MTKQQLNDYYKLVFPRKIDKNRIGTVGKNFSDVT